MNNELIGGMSAGMPGALGIPAAPTGSAGENGTGVASMENNSNIHIHRGVVGDVDVEGGASDLDARVHRWLNPVLKVVVTVQ